MIENLIESNHAVPFHYNQIENVLISNSSVILDLFYLQEINGLVLKDFPALDSTPKFSSQDLIEINTDQDLSKLLERGFKKEFTEVLYELLKSLNTTLIGVQITQPKKEMCPNIHIDKLPLRIVQCLDGPGTELFTSNEKPISTNKNDLIFMKGEDWKTTCGPLKHRSPQSPTTRRLLRIDFLN